MLSRLSYFSSISSSSGIDISWNLVAKRSDNYKLEILTSLHTMAYYEVCSSKLTIQSEGNLAYALLLLSLGSIQDVPGERVNTNNACKQSHN